MDEATDARLAKVPRMTIRLQAPVRPHPLAITENIKIVQCINI